MDSEEFKRMLLELGRRPTVEDVLRVREALVKKFALGGYKP